MENILNFQELLSTTPKRRQELLINSRAMEGIKERLEDSKQCNSKEGWKEFFFSEAYLEAHIQPDFPPLLAEYLKKQNIFPTDCLPKTFCVWLSILSGEFRCISQGGGEIRYVEVPDENSKFKAGIPLKNLLALQSDANNNYTEMTKKDYPLYRLCFLAFNDFMFAYQLYQQNPSYDFDTAIETAILEMVRKIEENEYFRAARGDLCKMLTFIVNRMKLSDLAKVALYEKYNMDHPIPMKEMEPLYEALKQNTDVAIFETAKKKRMDQSIINMLSTELKRKLLEVFRQFPEEKNEEKVKESVLTVTSLLENSRYSEIWLDYNFIDWLYNSTCTNQRVWSGLPCG